MSGNTFGTLFCVTSFGESQARPTAAWSTAVRRDGALVAADLQRELRAQEAWFLAPRHAAAGIRRGGDSLRRVRRSHHRHRDRLLSATKTSAARTTGRSPRNSVRDTPITPTGRSTACAIRAAAAAPRRARPWCARRGRDREEVAARALRRRDPRLLAQLGPITIGFRVVERCGQPVFAARRRAGPHLEAFMDERERRFVRRAGEGGGRRRRWAGASRLRRLDADIAWAMMAINAVKGVEIGAGFESIVQKGSEHGDEMTPDGFPATTTAACWAASPPGRTSRRRSRSSPLQHPHSASHDRHQGGKPTTIETTGRHDPCVGIRATPSPKPCLPGPCRSCTAAPRAMRRRLAAVTVDRAVKSTSMDAKPAIKTPKREEHEQQRASCYKTPFLNTLRKEHVPVSIYLVNGIKLQGQIESFDHTLCCCTTVTQMVYKHAISTVVPSRPISLGADNDPESQRILIEPPAAAADPQAAIVVCLDFGDGNYEESVEEVVASSRARGSAVSGHHGTAAKARSEALRRLGQGPRNRARGGRNRRDVRRLQPRALAGAGAQRRARDRAPRMDRTELILEIFAQRAQTNEGKLQVELAQLEHPVHAPGAGLDAPRAPARRSGQTGGPGETQLELDRRYIANRVRVLNASSTR